MTGLFLANPSKQHHVFFYRDPVTGAMAQLHIASGQQTEIGHDWNPAQIDKVIKQIERNGGRDAAEAHGHMDRFAGLLYRYDGQISTEEIEMGHAAVVDAQERRSADQATRAALGFDRAINRGRRGQRVAKSTRVEVKEELPPHAKRRGDEVEFAVEVDPEGRSDAGALAAA